MLQAVFAVRRRLLDRRGAKRQMAHSCFRRRRAHLRQGWTSSPSVRSDTRCGGARSLAAAGAAGPWRTAGGLAPTSQPWRARGRGRGKQEGREGGGGGGGGGTGRPLAPPPPLAGGLGPAPRAKTAADCSRNHNKKQAEARGRGARARSPPPAWAEGGGCVQEGRRLTWAWSRG
ncbi:unnamed protein product [Prorocentrum cordatum]|uniref:Uncharacterized protein n=1 Tax=Prorocentrum cordatum TaxID=2364126 RepID=A0ABN9SLQ9_9DINO|nr:unnamed protein product [Polarella glacialis]